MVCLSPPCTTSKPNDRSPSLPGAFPACFLVSRKLTLSRIWPGPQRACPLGHTEWRVAWASPAHPPHGFRKATRNQPSKGVHLSQPQDSSCSVSKEYGGFFLFGFGFLVFFQYLDTNSFPPRPSLHHSAPSLPGALLLQEDFLVHSSSSPSPSPLTAGGFYCLHLLFYLVLHYTPLMSQLYFHL